LDTEQPALERRGLVVERDAGEDDDERPLDLLVGRVL
jgi:hypothetical protein